LRFSVKRDRVEGLMGVRDGNIIGTDSPELAFCNLMRAGNPESSDGKNEDHSA
jgi:hypothetical protein